MEETIETEEQFDVVGTIKMLVENYGKLAEDIAEIKTAVMDELINPIKADYEQMQHDNALSDFRCKHAEKLEGFNDKLKALEGEDFDIVEKAFEDFQSREDGMDEDEYIDSLAAKVTEQLDAIGKAFGVEPNEVESVTVETKDGEEKTVEVENEVKEEENEPKAEPEEITESEESENEAEEVVEAEDEVKAKRKDFLEGLKH